MRRSTQLAILSGVIGLVAPLLLLEAILRFLPVRTGLQTLPVNGENPIRRFTPNREFTFSRGWKFQLVNRGRTNNFGFVNDQDYDSTAGTPLLAVIGDSYVEAQMVPYVETLHGRLARCVDSRGRVYSFGASGLPLSGYLGEAEFARDAFRPDAAAIVIVGNDFDESLRRFNGSPGVHVFRPGPAGLALERVDYVPRWDRRLLRESALARYLILNLSGGVAKARRLLRGERTGNIGYVGNTAAAVTPDRLHWSRQAVDAFLTELPAYAGLPPANVVLLVDAMRPAMYSAEDLAAASASFFDLMRRYLMERARAHGFEVVDLQQRFLQRHAADGSRFEFPSDHHWNGRGHEEAAAAVASSAVFERLFPSVCHELTSEASGAARP